MPKKKQKREPVRFSDRTGKMIPRRTAMIRARYDGAQTTDENARHWANADALSPALALTADVRAKLRMRCRYEVANNSYAKGIGLTLANDTIGTGPQVHLLTRDGAATMVETEFWAWQQSVRMAEKLRMMRFGRYDSGEIFAIQATNPGLPTPVKMDLWLVESEQIADPTFDVEPDSDDGIFYDRYGNPTKYRMLRTHPGGSGNWVSDPNDYIDIDAEWVDHYFRCDRPGQRRGIPDITPAMQLFAELRRYCAAVIAAAETAADVAMVLYTDQLPDDPNGMVEAEEFDTVELTRRMATTLPAGYKLDQMKAEQPTTVYNDFVATKLKEIARCVNVPFTIAAMDSSVSNMSAAYVDRQAYAAERVLERAELERLLDRWFDRWLTEAMKIPGYLPALPDRIPRVWRWPALGHHADPQKVANAAETNLKSGTTTIPRELAKQGLDFEEEQEAAAKSLGVSVDEYRALLRQNHFGPPKTNGEKPDETEPKTDRS